MESVTGDDCFRKLDLDEHVLFYFAAGWCAPCQETSPIMDELAKEYDSKKVKFFKVDMVNEENREFIEKCEVNNIPNIVLFKDREYIDRVVGANVDGIKYLVDYHVFGKGVNKKIKNVTSPPPQQPAPAPTQEEINQQIEDFYPNDSFQGEYEGFIFKKGDKGLGYYLDKGNNNVEKKKEPTDGSNTTGDGKTIDIHMVYGSWCGHSRNALPAFEELVPMKDIKTGAGSPVSFILTEDKSEGMKRFREGDPPVRGFPTYMVVKPDGLMEVLQGHNRSKDSIIDAVKNLTF